MDELDFLRRRKKRLTSFQVIILGFLGVILLGAGLLMLPLASRTGRATPFSEALFTATSAVCVTGLILQDTASYWSSFGQTVLLLLIQIGGLGVITVAASFAMLSGRRISLSERSTMQEAIAAPKLGGIVRLTIFILKTTLTIELVGAGLLATVFVKDFGPKGLWMGIFHAVSAFCNAGFDLLGLRKPFSSLTTYVGNPLVSLVIPALIILGGIGFLTWEDLRTHGIHWKKYRMQSKVILTTTGLLLLLPTLYFFFFEFSDMAVGPRLLASFFQSATPRTAGFNSVDLTSLHQSGQAILILLMLIGGSPGSTAGGMKTTTLAVLLATALASFRRKEEAQLYGRRMEEGVVKNAATIAFLYLTLFFLGGLVLSRLENLPLLPCLFETASAIGTVGLSLGITPSLGLASQGILILLMFFGRVGGLTLIYAALAGKEKPLAKLPLEKITVG